MTHSIYLNYSKIATHNVAFNLITVFLNKNRGITRNRSALRREGSRFDARFKRVIAKDVKSTYVRCAIISIVWVGGMPYPQTGATQCHAQLELPIKGLAVFNDWDLEPLDLPNGLALGVPWVMIRMIPE